MEAQICDAVKALGTERVNNHGCKFPVAIKGQQKKKKKTQFCRPSFAQPRCCLLFHSAQKFMSSEKFHHHHHLSSQPHETDSVFYDSVSETRIVFDISMQRRVDIIKIKGC